MLYSPYSQSIIMQCKQLFSEQWLFYSLHRTLNDWFSVRYILRTKQLWFFFLYQIPGLLLKLFYYVFMCFLKMGSEHSSLGMLGIWKHPEKLKLPLSNTAYQYNKKEEIEIILVLSFYRSSLNQWRPVQWRKLIPFYHNGLKLL